jgi:SagB-type dehydrogenase family enzyme
MSNLIGPEFINKTKYKHLAISDQQKGIEQPPLELSFQKGGHLISMPDPHNIKSDIKNTINKRTSIRSYRNKAITNEELSFLLWCTQGVKETYNKHWTLRTVPSAGARHALETFVLVNKVEDLKPGLYKYMALEHKIKEFILDEIIAARITFACFQQSFVKNSAVTFIWTAVEKRMTWRYDQRGYRYLFLDAGHVCQNLYLSAESIGCGVCAIAAFDDDEMNKLLQLDGNKQFVIYLATCGKK